MTAFRVPPRARLCKFCPQGPNIFEVPLPLLVAFVRDTWAHATYGTHRLAFGGGVIGQRCPQSKNAPHHAYIAQHRNSSIIAPASSEGKQRLEECSVFTPTTRIFAISPALVSTL